MGYQYINTSITKFIDLQTIIRLTLEGVLVEFRSTKVEEILCQSSANFALSHS